MLLVVCVPFEYQSWVGWGMGVKCVGGGMLCDPRMPRRRIVVRERADLERNWPRPLTWCATFFCCRLSVCNSQSVLLFLSVLLHAFANLIQCLPITLSQILTAIYVVKYVAAAGAVLSISTLSTLPRQCLQSRRSILVFTILT